MSNKEFFFNENASLIKEKRKSKKKEKNKNF
jgi:hypothetical protein